MAATEWGNAGSFELQVWMIDSNGYPMGQLATPDSPVAGTSYHALRTKSFTDLTAPTPTRSLATFVGAQTFLGQIDLGINDLGTGSVGMARFSEALVAMVSGSTIDETTLTDWTMSTSNLMNPNLPALGIMGSTKIRDENGNLSWVHVVLPNVQLRPPTVGISAGDGTNPNPSTYELVPSVATRGAGGRLFSAMAMGQYDDKDITYNIRYNSRLALTTHIVDSTMASTGADFIVGFRPTSTATGTPNSFTVNGGTLTPTAVNTTTGAVTVAAGETADDIIVALYPTNFVAI